MSTTFIHPDFLLETAAARELYHRVAESLPIVDYHCHLSPKDIANNRRFATMTEPWLEGDHYKWRAMRTCGVDERFITGNATPWEKFEKWAETVPRLLRNPLYHWTHLELARPFGITDRLLSPSTARSIWDDCNARLATPEFSTRGIMRQMKVEIVCTTDDPVDSLEYHEAMLSDPSFTTRVYPAFRPDRAMAVENLQSYHEYLEKLSAVSGVEISSYSRLIEALAARHQFFHDHGCRLSDHGLENMPSELSTTQEATRIFERVLNGKALDVFESHILRCEILVALARMDAESGWVQQFHLGAYRNTNSRMMRTIGPDTGYDSIGDFPMAVGLARFLNRLDDQGKLAKTILYNLNPSDNEVFATMIGNFQDGTVPGKIQYGSAWWFLDQLDGMTKQINALSTMGVLSTFVGMLTDSRSFLSYPRHEYFRRLLCNIFGNDVEGGLIPRDMELISSTVRAICYENARRYLALPESVPGPKAHAARTTTKEVPR